MQPLLFFGILLPYSRYRSQFGSRKFKSFKNSGFQSARLNVVLTFVPCVEGRTNYLLASSRGATFLDEQVPVEQHFGGRDLSHRRTQDCLLGFQTISSDLWCGTHLFLGNSVECFQVILAVKDTRDHSSLLTIQEDSFSLRSL